MNFFCYNFVIVWITGNFSSQSKHDSDKVQYCGAYRAKKSSVVKKYHKGNHTLLGGKTWPEIGSMSLYYQYDARRFYSIGLLFMYTKHFCAMPICCCCICIFYIYIHELFVCIIMTCFYRILNSLCFLNRMFLCFAWHYPTL